MSSVHLNDFKMATVILTKLSSSYNLYADEKLGCSFLFKVKFSHIMSNWNSYPCPLPPGPSAGREILCLPPGHRRHAEGHGGFRLWAWQEAQGDHGFWQTGKKNNDNLKCNIMWCLGVLFFLQLLFTAVFFQSTSLCCDWLVLVTCGSFRAFDPDLLELS